MTIGHKKANADYQPSATTDLGRDGYYFNYNIHSRVIEAEERVTYDYEYVHVLLDVKQGIREMGLGAEFDLRKNNETLKTELYEFLKDRV